MEGQAGDARGSVARRHHAVRASRRIGLVEESSNGPLHVGAVLRYVEESAPSDVLRAIAWLESHGWLVQSARGGHDEPFGNAVVELDKEGARIVVIRDRGQWMMDIHPAGWKGSVDLDIILDTIAGRKDWSDRLSGRLPQQLPLGVAWRDALPMALAWLASAHEAERSVRMTMRMRGRSLV